MLGLGAVLVVVVVMVGGRGAREVGGTQTITAPAPPQAVTTERATAPTKRASPLPAGPAAPPCPAGCSCLFTPGDSMYNCSLPSGQVEIEEFDVYINFYCYSGTLRFSELPLREEVGSSAGNGGAGGARRVLVSGCALAQEPLRLALQRRAHPHTPHPPDAATLTLKAPRSPLLPVHLQGLNLTSLRITDLDGAEMEVPLEAIEALPTLSDLAINDGRLALGRPLPALPLRTLELGNDRLRALPPAPFRLLPQLRRLSLWKNAFTDIRNDTLQGLESLEELSLSSNELSRLPEGLLAPARLLTSLDLYDNKLALLPRGLLAGLHHLQQVRLKDNRANLTLEGGAFSELRSLKRLELSRNGLAALPGDAFSGCAALQVLQLDGNALRSLPPGLLAGLSALKELKLDRNRLAAIPADFFATQQNLTRLNLDNNDLKTLPSYVFRGLSNLEELSLRRNKLHSIEYGAFVSLDKLLELELGSNELALGAETALAEGHYGALGGDSPFAALKRLEHLGLERNRVLDVLDDWRNLLVALHTLDLSYNNISYINYVSINFVGSNVKVNLSHNNISSVNLSGESFGNAEIQLDDNPFTCDCLTPALQAALRRGAAGRGLGDGGGGGGGGPLLLASRAACAGPSALRGLPLLQVPRERLQCEAPAPLCPPPCRCLYSVDLMAVECASLPAASLPSPRDFRLNATRLRLHRVASSLRSLPSHVKELDLSELQLTRVPALPPAAYVDLSGNRLAEAPLDQLETNNNTVRLARNPLACDCAHQAAVAALLAAGPTTILDFGDVACSDSTPVRKLQGVDLCAQRNHAIMGSVAGVALLLLGVALLLCRRYRYRCLMCLDRLCCCPPQDDEAEGWDKDAFLSYAHPDVEYAKKIMSFLEGSPHTLKVCNHERDWLVGEQILKQIAASVRRSRWTVVLLSKHFLESVWGLVEFREAYTRMQRERKGRLLIVLLDDVMNDPRMDSELRAYVANTTYLHFDDRRFLDKLAYALRRPRVPWWRSPAAPAPSLAPTPAPADKLILSAMEAKIALEGPLANPAFVGPAATKFFSNTQRHHNFDTRNAQVA